MLEALQRQLWDTAGNFDSHIPVLQTLLTGILFAFLGPPEFKVEPYDTTINSGDSLVMNCVAEGEPTPTITWRKESTILHNGLLERVAILNNDSLRYILLSLPLFPESTNNGDTIYYTSTFHYF